MEIWMKGTGDWFHFLTVDANFFDNRLENGRDYYPSQTSALLVTARWPQ